MPPSLQTLTILCLPESLLIVTVEVVSIRSSKYSVKYRDIKYLMHGFYDVLISTGMLCEFCFVYQI